MSRAELTPEEVSRLKDKYRRERDKRATRPPDEVLDLSGDLERYKADPYTPVQPRDAVRGTDDVVIVGAGLGGLLAAARLRAAGVERIRVVDTAGDVGGVWYWNRYPGAMCDVESYIYLPLLEEIGYVPRDKYARAEEILSHTQAVARHFDLYRDALFHTAVSGMTWVEETGRWTVTTDRGDELHARFVVLAMGTLSKPRLPAIPGLETFDGDMFHTSRWNYEVTGGSPDGVLDRLAHKRVAVVGTGATAIQCVPPLGRSAQEVLVVQRTPSSVSPRNNRRTDPAFETSLEPGWQRQRLDNFTRIVEGGYASEDLVDDGWTQTYKRLFDDAEKAAMSAADLGREIELADIERMNGVRSRIDQIVEDPEQAELLKPYYDYLCKRPCFHDEYLQAFNLDNVRVIDTAGQGLEGMCPEGIIVQGRKYPVDVVVFATGFELGDNSAEKVGFPVTGRGGVSLEQKWSDGMASLHGIMTSGFPNFFIFPSINSQHHGAVNWTHLLYDTADHISHVISTLRARGLDQFDVDVAAEAAWISTILARRVDNSAFLQACTPGRVNNEGRPELKNPKNSNYGGGFLEMLQITARWRERGDLEGLVTG